MKSIGSLSYTYTVKSVERDFSKNRKVIASHQFLTLHNCAFQLSPIYHLGSKFHLHFCHGDNTQAYLEYHLPGLQQRTHLFSAAGTQERRPPRRRASLCPRTEAASPAKRSQQSIAKLTVHPSAAIVSTIYQAPAGDPPAHLRARPRRRHHPPCRRLPAHRAPQIRAQWGRHRESRPADRQRRPAEPARTPRASHRHVARRAKPHPAPGPVLVGFAIPAPDVPRRLRRSHPGPLPKQHFLHGVAARPDLLERLRPAAVAFCQHPPPSPEPLGPLRQPGPLWRPRAGAARRGDVGDVLGDCGGNGAADARGVDRILG